MAKERALIHLKPVAVDLGKIGKTGDEFEQFSTHEKMIFVENCFDFGKMEIDRVEIVNRKKEV